MTPLLAILRRPLRGMAVGEHNGQFANVPSPHGDGVLRIKGDIHLQQVHPRRWMSCCSPVCAGPAAPHRPTHGSWLSSRRSDRKQLKKYRHKPIRILVRFEYKVDRPQSATERIQGWDGPPQRMGGGRIAAEELA